MRALLAFLCVTLAVVLLPGCGSSPKPRALIVYEAQVGEATNVYTIDPQSGASRQITAGTSFDGNPAWSPDRKRILFSSRRDGQSRNDLYTMDADGSNVSRLTDTPDAGEWSAKFSQDGSQIAYVREASDGWSVWLMRADGSERRRLAGVYPLAEFPSWAPGGRDLYFAAIMPTPAGTPTASLHIYSVDITTGSVRTRIDTGGTDVCPHFSRDGKWLTYAAGRAGGEYASGNNLDLFAHDLSSDDTTGAHDVALTDDPARDDYGNASPDGTQMVFVSDRDGNAELYLMDRDGSHQRRLTSTPDARENVPDW
jgi:Tol biopolymer transport system component